VASPASVLNLMVVANTAPANAALLGTQARLRATANTARMSGKTMAKAFGGVALAAGAAGVALFKVGQEFDDSYDKIRTQTGATGKEMVKLKRSFRDVVSDVPTDFANAGKAVGELNTRLGLSGKPLDRMAKQMLELSRLTETDLSTNISNVSRAFVDWEVATKDQTKTLDGFFRLSQKSGLAVSDIAANVQKFGSPLRQLGFTLDEAAAMFASFERAGVNIQTMVPGLKLAISNLTRPTDTLAVSMKKLGIEAGDPEKALKQVFAILSDKNLDQVTKTGLAMDVFGKRAGADMAEAVNQGRFELDKFLGVMNNGQGTILETGRKTRDLAEHFQVFVNNVKLALEPLAKDVFKGVSNLMKEITRAFKQGGIEEVVKLLAAKLEEAVPKIMEAGVKIGAKLGEAVLKGFLNAPLWVQLATGAFLLRGAILGGIAKAGSVIGGKLATAIGTRLAATQTGMMLSNSLAVVGWGPVGAAIGVALGVGIAAYLGTKVGPKLADTMKRSIESADIAAAAKSVLDNMGDLEFRKWAEQSAAAGNKITVQMVNDWRKAGEVTENQAERMKQALRTLRGTTQEENKKMSQAFVGMSNDARKALHGTGEDTKRELGNAARDGTKRAGDLRKGVVANVENMADGVRGGLQNVVNNTNKALKGFGVKKSTYVAFEAERANLPQGNQRGGIIKAQAGTLVPGRGNGDRVPAMLEPGEVVVNKRAVAAMGGAGRVNKINKLVPRFAAGGVAQPPGDPGSEVVQAAYAGEVGNFLKRFNMDLTQGYNPSGPSVSAGHNSLSAPPSLDLVPLGGDWDGLFAQGLKWALAQGMQVGYDGQYGTQSWSGHGEGNHAHIDWKSGGKLGAVVQSIKDMVLKGPAGALREIGQKGLDKAVNGANQMLSRVAPSVADTAGIGGGALSAQEFIQIANQAIRLTRPESQGFTAAGLLRLAMAESSLDPNSINNWDSNAAAGNPSGGLMHTTLSTFKAYHEPGTAKSYFDPLASIAASINYQDATYGGQVTHSPYQLGGIVQKLRGGGAARRRGNGGSGDPFSGPESPTDTAAVNIDHGWSLLPKKWQKNIKKAWEDANALVDDISLAVTKSGWASSEMGTDLGPGEHAEQVRLNQGLLGTYQSLVDKYREVKRELPADDPLKGRVDTKIKELIGPPTSESLAFGVRDALEQLGVYTPGETEPSEIDSLRADLLSQQLTEARSMYAVSQAQLPVFQRWAGVAHNGMVLPGTASNTYTLRAQGGEVVSPAGGGPTHITVYIGDREITDIAAVEVNGQLQKVAERSTPVGGVAGRRATYK
jgi:TP901 family phage tail tape measure protein